MPITPATQKTLAQAMIPMWDSSDPMRNPAPLPPNPRDPTSPKSNMPAPKKSPEGESGSREDSPVRRGRTDSFGAGGPLPTLNPTLNPTPTRQPSLAPPVHKRATSNQPSSAVREKQNLLLNGGKPETSSTRHSIPNPKDLPSSVSSFSSKIKLDDLKLKDEFQFPKPVKDDLREYSSASFRQSLDFEKTPSLQNIRSRAKTPEVTNPPTASSLTHLRMLTGSEFEDMPSKYTNPDFHTLTSQLTGLTTIATNLQREMTNLSRRSQDNARDLLLIREAAKSRDEEIRQSLRDLEKGLTSFEAADRLLGAPPPRLSIIAPSISSGSDSDFGEEAKSAAPTQALERLMREMPTKEDQEQALLILADIREQLNSGSTAQKSHAEEKILAFLEDLTAKEEVRGKQLIRPGAPRDPEDEDRVITMLEELQRDIQLEKPGEQRIMSILEEIKVKEAATRNDENILAAIDELKGKDVADDERLNHVVALLEQIRDREVDDQVAKLVQEVIVKVEQMNTDLCQRLASISVPTTSGESPGPSSAAYEDILRALDDLKRGIPVESTADSGIMRSLEDWKTEYEQNIGATLKELSQEIEALATEQRATAGRLAQASFAGLPSQALVPQEMRLPRELDNEAAVSALANIASTTLRTDLTMSSISALIKVFQKEQQSSSVHSAEALTNMERYMEDIRNAMSAANVQASEARKILEVVRTHVCTGKDSLAEFRDSAQRQIEELTYIVKHLHRSIFGPEEEAPWKKDAGVRENVEELAQKVDRLAEKNLQAWRKSGQDIANAIAEASPASLIAELKTALGAMAQRSLEAFRKSENEVQLLKAEVINLAERTGKTADGSDSKDFRSEFQEIAQRTLSICETIDQKVGNHDELKALVDSMKSDLNDLINNSTDKFTSEAATIRTALESFKGEMDSRVEDTIATAVAAASSDEKTAAALEELKTEVSGTLSKAVALPNQQETSEKVLASIAELRKEVGEILEKSNTALVAPTQSPDGEEIKAKIELLARGLSEAMEKTAAIAASSASSTTEAEKMIKSVAERLRQEIEDMGTSIAAAVATGSASAYEEGIQKSLDEVKGTVLDRIDKTIAASDKTMGSIADLSKETRESIDRLKEDVIEMINNSVSMALTPRSQTESGINKQLLDALRIDIEDTIVSAVAAGTGADELKEQIEKLRADVDIIGKKDPPEVVLEIKALLETVKTDLASVVKSAASGDSSASSDIKASMDELRKEIRDLLAKSGSAVPRGPIKSGDSSASSVSASTPENIPEMLNALKSDFNDMVENTLAAAITTSSFDSEQKVTAAIEELKRDVKDTLEKAMIPFAKHGNEGLLREAMGALRQEIATMFEKRATVDGEDKANILQRLDALKGHFGELLQMSTSVEVKEAVDILKIQVHGLLEKSSGAEYAELRQAIENLKLDGTSGDGSKVLEKLSEIQTQFAEISARQPPEDIKDTITSLSLRVQDLADKPFDANVKTSLDKIESRLEEISSKSAGSDPAIKDQIEALKVHVTSIAVASKDGDSSPIIEAIKAQIEQAIEKSTTNLSKFDDVLEVKMLVEDLKKDLDKVMAKTPGSTDTTAALESLKIDLKAMLDNISTTRDHPPATGPSSESQMNEVKVALDSLKADIKLALERTAKPVAGPETADGASPTLNVDPESVAEVGTAVGECRVEVAVVRTLVEEKAAETKNLVSQIAKSHSETQGAISTISASLGEYKTDAMDGVAAIKSSIRDLSIETNGWITSVKTSSLDSHEKTIADVKGMLNAAKEDSKERFAGINKTIDGAKFEVKDAVAAVDVKVESGQSNIQSGISEIKSSLEQSKTDQEAAVATLAATIETSQVDTKQEVTAVKTLVEESRQANDAHHDKTQKQVDQVLSLVDGLSTEWKGQQPELFNALLEMKNLLLDAQKAAAEKPEIELPPPYDDSQTQKKLDQLIDDHDATSAKMLPQLGLLDTIQKQVAATSSDIAQFLEYQKSIIQVDSDAKARAAKECEIELERAITQKRIVEAATDSLRREHDKLHVSVELLKEDVEDLRTRKLQLTRDLAALETALNLRREELVMLEARGDALERRMLEGVIEQTRALLTKPKSRSYKKHKKYAKDAALRKVQDQPSQIKPKMIPSGVSATPGRRHLSLGQMNDNLLTSQGGRSSLGGGGNIGLGQKEYTASLGLLGRSNSLKQTAYAGGRRTTSMEQSTIKPVDQDVSLQYDHPTEDPVSDDIPEEEEVEEEEEEEDLKLAQEHEFIEDDEESEEEGVEDPVLEEHLDVGHNAAGSDHEDDDIDHLDELNDLESEAGEGSGVDIGSEEEEGGREGHEEEEEESDEEEEEEEIRPLSPPPAAITVTKRKPKGFRPNPKYEEPASPAEATRNVSGVSSIGSELD